MSFTRAPEEEIAVKQAVLNYIELRQTANRAQAERYDDPHLAKCMFWMHDPAQHPSLPETREEVSCLIVKNDSGEDLQFQPNSKHEMMILDICGSVASIKVAAERWVDYLHVVKLNGEWRVVNALWALQAPDLIK